MSRRQMLEPQKIGRDEVVTDEFLLSLDALPVCAQIITYGASTPRTFWANRLFLSLVGLTLEELLAQDLSTHTDVEKSEWEHRFHATQQLGEVLVERSSFSRATGPVQLENVVQPILFKPAGATAGVSACLITGWPVSSVDIQDASTKYMTSLLECSPYPLCFFTFDGHLINCNPAARKVFGTTIWLQSDIFGMDERERRGLSDVQQDEGSFRIERGGRRTAYDNMMDALSIDGTSFEVDLPMKLTNADSTSTLWYCRVFAQRRCDPVTGEPIIMVSHQDVTNLRKVEGELGRMQMLETTEKELKHDQDVAGSLLELMKHDQDVAGSLLVLLGEEWGVANNAPPGAVMGNIQDDSAAWAPGRMPMSQGGRAEAAPVVATTRPAGPDVEEDAAKSNQLH
ncbi:hypothetical protein T484DRAFT_1834842, partial [Baffinella frigidus]